MTESTGPSVPQGYEARDYPPFAVTVDIVVLTIEAGTLKVLLVKRADDPYAGAWALPGGFKRPDETLDAAAARELREETGAAAADLRQFHAYGDPGRDPRLNVVTIGYLAVVRDVGELIAGTDAVQAALWPVADVINGALPLAFDHRQIAAQGVERARSELESTSLAAAFVGPEFTLSQLREVYETVWDVELDPANFRRSMLGSAEAFIRPTGRTSAPSEGGGRPAEVYQVGASWRPESPSPVRRESRRHSGSSRRRPPPAPPAPAPAEPD